MKGGEKCVCVCVYVSVCVCVCVYIVVQCDGLSVIACKWFACECLDSVREKCHVLVSCFSVHDSFVQSVLGAAIHSMGAPLMLPIR